jgi:uncharacterized protein YjeT (DUF2065 family)
MGTELVLQKIFALVFVIIGLSHIVQPKAWAEFFTVVKNTGVAGLIIAMYTLPVGLVLVVTHNRWGWDWPVLLTLAGWGMTVKGAVYIVAPAVADRALSRFEKQPRRFMQAGGGISALIGIVLTWRAYMS